MKKISILLLSVFIFSCQSKENKTTNDNTSISTDSKKLTNSSNENNSEKVTLKPIILEFKFTPALEEKLKSSSENIEMSVFLSTDYEWSEEDKKEFNDIFTEKEEVILASKTLQTPMTNSIIIDGINLDKKIFEKIGEEKILVEINIYSGRKVFENNIMSCDFVSEKYTDLINAPVVIKGDLL